MTVRGCYTDQENIERDFVRRFLALGALAPLNASCGTEFQCERTNR
jgi:hypothetical protein